MRKRPKHMKVHILSTKESSHVFHVNLVALTFNDLLHMAHRPTSSKDCFALAPRWINNPSSHGLTNGSLSQAKSLGIHTLWMNLDECHTLGYGCVTIGRSGPQHYRVHDRREVSLERWQLNFKIHLRSCRSTSSEGLIVGQFHHVPRFERFLVRTSPPKAPKLGPLGRLDEGSVGIAPTLGGEISGQFERYGAFEKFGYMILEGSVCNLFGVEGINLKDVAAGGIHIRRHGGIKDAS